jgi:hypothetical protein
MVTVASKNVTHARSTQFPNTICNIARTHAQQAVTTAVTSYSKVLQQQQQQQQHTQGEHKPKLHSNHLKINQQCTTIAALAPAAAPGDEQQSGACKDCYRVFCSVFHTVITRKPETSLLWLLA